MQIFYPLRVPTSDQLTGSHDRTLRVWDTESGYCTQTLLCVSACNFAALAPLANTCATAHLDGHVRLWSLPNGALIYIYTHLFLLLYYICGVQLYVCVFF